MTARITDFWRNKRIENMGSTPRMINFPRIIDFEEAVNRIALNELTKQESLFEKDDGSENRCNSYHPTVKGFRRELRQGNPDCLCCVCDGYNEECPAYEPRR